MNSLTRLLSLVMLASRLLPAAGTFQTSSIPFTFEPNRGQSDRQVRYLGHASDAAIWFTDSAIVLTASKDATIRMTFAGGNPHPRVQGVDPTAGRTNYFSGDSSNWRTGIPQFQRVRYSRVYPGVDLLFYGNPSTLEYDWIVQPGADPRAIRMSIDGATSLDIAPEGDLVMNVGSARIRARKPHVYQDGREVAGRFVREGSLIGFEIGAYDATKQLTIDPVLTYATYIGGSTISFGALTGNPGATAPPYQDVGNAIAVDSQGNVIIVGGSYSSDFPLKDALYSANAGFSAVVMKVNPNAVSANQFILWSTYLGGAAGPIVAGSAQATAVALDAQGNVYVTGISTGTFPVKGGFQTAPGATCSLPTECADAFVSKISADGMTLVYSSYLGGNADDFGQGIAVDATGDAFVVGQTKSANFPLTKALQSTITGTSSGFITEVAPSGSSMLVSTFFGGERDQLIAAIAADKSGNIYVTGWTTSAKFPVLNSFQGANPDSPNSDGFVSEFNVSASGLKLVYSTYLGDAVSSGGYTAFNSLALDGQGDIVVAGSGYAPNYPVSANALQPTYVSGVTPAVITKLKPSAAGQAQLLYSTYFPADTAWAAFDSSGRIVVASYSDGSYPATPDGFQPYDPGDPVLGNLLGSKGFLAVIDPTQKNQIVYGSYFGGLLTTTPIQGFYFDGLAFDATGVVVLGNSYEPDDYASANAFQTSGNKISKMFLARFDMTQTGPVITSATNAASYAPVTGFVPGEIITFFGTGIGPAQLQYSTLDANGNIGNTVAGCQVIINDVAAPMIYASATQTSAIIPYEVAGNLTNGYMNYARIFCNGVGGNAWYAAAAPSAPGIFALNDGTTQGAILNADGSPNSRSNPAAPGSVIVFFATGEGSLTPAGRDGHVENGPTLPKPTLPVQVTFGPTSAASIQYAGVAPQSVDGLMQVNAQVPASLPPGNIQLTLQVGTAKSQGNLTVAVGASQ